MDENLNLLFGMLVIFICCMAPIMFMSLKKYLSSNEYTKKGATAKAFFILLAIIMLIFISPLIIGLAAPALIFLILFAIIAFYGDVHRNSQIQRGTEKLLRDQAYRTNDFSEYKAFMEKKKQNL